MEAKLSPPKEKVAPISFTEEDARGVAQPQNDPIVVSLGIDDCTVRKVLVDQGAEMDVMVKSCFDKLGLDQSALSVADFTIRGITHNPTPVYGTVTLLTEFDDGELTRIVPITYVVADLPTPYNMIIGRPALNRINAVASTYH